MGEEKTGALPQPKWLDLSGAQAGAMSLISMRKCSWNQPCGALPREGTLPHCHSFFDVTPFVEVFLMRNVLLGLGMLAVTACASGALAQSKPLPPASSDVMPPVELTITMDGDKPICAPAELKLPANTNVELHIVSQAAEPVTVTAPGQFENAHVLHADGDLVHVASEKGYLVKQHGKGVLRIRTLQPGQETYACTSNRNQKAPFEGKLVLTPPAG